MPRKEKKYHFIYKTTNIKTGKYYYGMHSTNNLDDGYLGSGKRLRYSINKYGKENHSREILEFLDSREDLKNREREIVNLNEIAKTDCLNLGIGGQGGYVSEKQARLGAEAMNKKLWNDSEWRRRKSKLQSELTKKLHKEGIITPPDWTGRSHSEETKKKMSKSSNNKGENNSQYGTMWIHNMKLKKSKKINKNESIPEGWKKGRKLKF